ncbi:MAG TPA: hypothetical protein VFR79_00415, partial [Nitrospira sp.]|nr:hypothetical protein [Nitrospira sp.]
MSSHDQLLAEFRSHITRRLQERDREWEASRRLIESSHLVDTLSRLVESVRGSNLPLELQEFLLDALNQGRAQRVQDLSGPKLKALTGLPPSKALRAMCVCFDVVEQSTSRWQTPTLDSDTVMNFLRDHRTPFDLLLTADVASVLDLGAGDLSFAAELADLYGPKLHRQNRTLILHGIDRLRPESKLGGPLHPPQELIQRLRSRSDLSFRFLPDQDMCEFDQLARTGRLATRYAVSTCWAPATPTFAYEPARLSREVIQGQLRQTKGPFRQTRFGGEAALEVQHRDRRLLFPSWKFEIRGPLALLDLLARSSHLGVLGAVDSQVFWELLAQLLEEKRYRPTDQPFTSDNVPTILGEIYERLSALEIGETLDLSTCGTLRADLPRALPGARLQDGYRFRSVVIRRGAVFPDMPASST